jgi:hypothetical protein
MEKQLLIDFADWLWDMDRLKVTTQLPPFENSGMMVEMFLKAKMMNDQCDGKTDSTSEKDLRVCEVINSDWISVKERLPGTEEHIVLFYDGRVDFGWYSLVRNVFYSGAYERDVTHWMPMPCQPENSIGI